MMLPMQRIPSLDFIAIGDTTLDVFLQISEATVSCQLNRAQCLLCLEYAEKIPVEAVVKVPGAGNASNAAVGARRLGLKSAIVATVGKDTVGDEIRAGWKKEGVDTRYVTLDAKDGTNYSTVLNFHGERTILVFAHERKYKLPTLDGAKWIYYTSLGPGHEKLEKQLVAHLKKHPQQKLAFNPGTKQLRRGLKALKPVIARCDVFIVNKEEAARLLEDGERPIQNMLMNFIHLGAKVVVITDGPKGSFATDGTRVWKLGIFKGPVIERTGAGDSYGTAFTCAIAQGHDIPEAMRHGTANGWSVVQKIGPQAGLLDARSMKATLKKFSKIKPSLVS